MNVRRMSKLGVATFGFGLAMLVSAAPALAASFTFITDGGNNTTTSTTKFTSNKVGDTTLNVRVSAWQAVDRSDSTDIDNIQRASLGLWDAGLGVTGYLNGSSGASETTKSGHHQIDNIGNVDFVMLQFDRAVSLTSIDREVFGMDGVSGQRSDAAYWADTGGFLGSDWTKVYDLTSATISEKLWTEIGGGASANTGTLTGNKTVYGTSAVPTASVWLVGASFLPDRKDGFKISALNVNYTPSAVPEPATWAMMVLGFGAVGGALRGRRSAKGGVVSLG